MKKISVLIVDDSALIRQMFSEILSAEPDIEVLETACDPFDAREKIKRYNPDVLTLDIEMPKMDGLSFLEKIMSLRPMPVIMVSSLTQKGADTSIRALELGAFDTIGKSSHGGEHELALLKEELVTKVRAAAKANMSIRTGKKVEAGRSLSFNARLSGYRNVIAIGASTGGVEALRELFLLLPENTPPIVITQHMPELFTNSFAKRLNSLAAMSISEAKNHDRLKAGHAYLAPGGIHMKVVRVGQDLVCKLEDGPPVSSHKPSVDVLFHSVATAVGARAIGVILTGMGKDGAVGLKAMRESGAYTIGQNQETCVVYGMPQVAQKIGAVQTELSLWDIPANILQACENQEEL